MRTLSLPIFPLEDLYMHAYACIYIQQAWGQESTLITQHHAQHDVMHNTVSCTTQQRVRHKNLCYNWQCLSRCPSVSKMVGLSVVQRTHRKNLQLQDKLSNLGWSSSLVIKGDELARTRVGGWWAGEAGVAGGQCQCASTLGYQLVNGRCQYSKPRGRAGWLEEP